MEEQGTLSIYKAVRTIKKRDNSLYNALRSIYEDSIFVGEIAQLWSQLPLLANLRCGLWYSPKFHTTCYFKSTDGHTNNWSFNTSRLNLHVAHLAGQKGGCIVVDSTRKGKRFPDSMSKTIPIWTCVLNRAILNYRCRIVGSETPLDTEPDNSNQKGDSVGQLSHCWDCSLHLPLWVSAAEKAAIEGCLEGWTKQLEACGADIGPLSQSIKKPLRPLWISQKTVIWLNEVPEHDSWDFNPIILLSASASCGTYQQRTTSEFSWNYIAGAGDDEESWARGLAPSLFWNRAYDIINSGPDLCNQKVADIVEKYRVYNAQGRHNDPQVSVKHSKSSRSINPDSAEKPSLDPDVTDIGSDIISSSDNCTISWLGSTNLAVGAIQFAADASSANSILICDRESTSLCLENSESFLQLSIVGSKYDRFSLLRNLPSALNFAKLNLRAGKRLLVCCNNGEDISICVCLAILTSLFSDGGCFDDGRSFRKTCITKLEMRKRLVFICKFSVHARPSRGNLKQVFNYFHSGNCGSDS